LSATLARLGRLLHGPAVVEAIVGRDGPVGDLLVPSGHDGVWETTEAQGRACLRPVESSYYLYFVLPAAARRRAASPVHVEVEYFGPQYGEFRLQYASAERGGPWDGLYKMAEQRWQPEAAGLRRFRRAMFSLPDFDPARTQHLGASFRLEFRRELLVARVRVHLEPPPDLASFTTVAPLPELRKMPGRLYPIDYLFIEITNACNFKCTWCPDEIMDRRRGFMKKDRVFRLVDEIAEKRPFLGPLFPVKLHQMGEPMLHPDLAAIVERAEARGVPIELNTNCGLITEEKVDALYRAGLTNLILSYQTPDAATFRTRKAPRLVFDEYRDKVRLAVERKVVLGARTNIEIDIMNTKYADGYHIVSEDDQAVAFLTDWIAFSRELERRHSLPPRAHDLAAIGEARFLDRDENGSRYTLLDGVHLVWKRCHTWGNVIGGHLAETVVDTYCPSPHDQFVIQWNGDVVSCCTDYEGLTKTANVFASSIEDVWRGEARRQRLRDMGEGRLLDVCARCQGLK
jgi:MoaA/NifB/PqqE/SkfB family radical SAM enzyme